jgi:hypothetical protein
MFERRGGEKEEKRKRGGEENGWVTMRENGWVGKKMACGLLEEMLCFLSISPCRIKKN